MKIFVRYWLPVLFAFALIFYLSSLPALTFPKVEIPFFDKFVHICLYGLLGFSLARVFTLTSDRPFSFINCGPSILAAIVIASVYGVSDEFHQSFVPGRAVELFDVLADVTGATLGSFFV